MVHAFGLLLLILQLKEFADSSYVQMLLQTHQHIQDVFHFRPQQLAPHQELPVLPKLLALHIN